MTKEELVEKFGKEIAAKAVNEGHVLYYNGFRDGEDCMLRKIVTILKKYERDSVIAQLLREKISKEDFTGV